MRNYVSGLLACCLISSACLFAATIKGKVIDQSGSPISGAQISVISRTGVEAQAIAGRDGSFELNAAAGADDKLVITAPGFSAKSVAPADAASVQLEIAPQTDSVRVLGSAIDVPASQQGGSVSIITNQEIRQRNEPFAVDLLRYIPGVAFNQTGSTGGVASLFLRGGYANFNLVQIDGVPVNQFGGAFDFAHIPSEALESIEVVRGPQSAIYGPYANSGAINFITRQPQAAPELDLLAEGGSYGERRFGITGTGTVAGFGISATASRVDDNGPVPNSDYWNELAMVNLTRRFGNQRLSLHADIDANDAGEPGAYGSDPKATFSGIDLISRSHNDTAHYSAHYEADLSGRVRQELTGSFFQNNSGFASPFGFSFDNNLRGQGEARTIVSVTPHYTAAFGVSAGREEDKNTFITDASFAVFPMRRNDFGIYMDNRFDIGGRLFLDAGVRGEIFQTLAIPADGFSHPVFPENTISTVNPKFAASYILWKGARAHASAGSGMRVPNGFELAYTTNPGLKPERTRSLDAGVEQKLFGNLLLLDATFFYNRYYDLIVSLGGSLSKLSHYTTDNLANSRAYGSEFSASLRPARWIFITGSYTLVETKILSLDGSTGLAPNPFQVGQELTRRPRNSGELVATYARGKVTANVTGYFRGNALFEEPAFGATNGLFWNPGYADVGINLNYALGRGLTAYGNLRNALNQHYEEVFGFPSPRLNFVAGMKWSIAKRQ